MTRTSNKLTRALMAAAVAFAVLFSWTAPTFAQESRDYFTPYRGLIEDSIPHPGLTNKSEVLTQKQSPQAQFDGYQTYKAAFELLRDYHVALADQATRSKWAAEWESKHAKDGVLDSEAGTDKAIAEMVASLGQRFDGYMDPEQVKADDERSNSSLVGIGVSIQLTDIKKVLDTLPANASRQDVENAMKVSDDHPLTVIEPVEGGPAEAAGIQKGDRLTKVNGKDTGGMLLKDVVDMIRGKEDTTVDITYERSDGKGGTTTGTVTITRKTVISKVVTFKDLGNGVSYIKLRNFVSQYTIQEMQAALQKAAGGKSLIIDLRDNGGGRLDYVLTISAFLLPDGTVLETHNRNGNQLIERRVTLLKNFVLNAEPHPQQPGATNFSINQRPPLLIPADMPIVVLVNENSASASEILAGVLQHHKRATVVGKTTLGKGVGQTVVQLPFGRKLRVTSFEFLPGGEKMDWIGVIPDYEADQPDTAGDDKQLESAQKVAGELTVAKEALDKKKSDLKQEKEEEFRKKSGTK